VVRFRLAYFSGGVNPATGFASFSVNLRSFVVVTILFTRRAAHLEPSAGNGDHLEAGGLAAVADFLGVRLHG